MPVSIAVLPIGSTDITNDIALGLNISLEEAEQIKLGGITGTQVSRKKLNEIIQARLTDIFELIESHLESIGKKGMLPAGIIITGGGSGVTTIEDMAKATLDLPSKIADVKFANNPKLGIKDPSWAVAYGLTIYGFNDDASKKSTSALFKNAKRTFFSWIKRFLP